MKSSILKLTAVFLVLIASFSACKKSSNSSSFAGNYVIGSAILSASLVVPTTEAGDITVPVGTNITTLIQNSLLSAVTCSSADKSWVELRSDFSLYLSCQGSNPLNAGTWEEVSSTELNLNLNSQAIPSSPAGVVLTVSNIVKDQTGLTGQTSVPLPKELVAGLLTPLQLTLSQSAPSVFIASFSVQFTKK